MSSKKPKLHDGYVLSLPLEDKLIGFYRDSPYNRVVVRPKVYGVEVFKVDEDKVILYEEMCETYRQKFMELGLLRLHTPLDVHEERLGTTFLHVPPTERARMERMLGGKSVITRSNPSLGYTEYCVVEEGRDEAQITLRGKLVETSLFDYRMRIRGTPDGLAACGLLADYCVVQCFELSELAGSLEHMKRFVFEFEGEDDDDPNNLDSNSKRYQRQFFFGIPYEEAYDQSHVEKKDRFFFCELDVEGMFIQREETWLEKIFG